MERARVPFDSVEKRSIVAVEHPNLHETVRVYTKGAPEVVFASCTEEFSETGEKIPMEEGRVAEVQQKVNASMSAKAQRALAFAYKDMHVEDFEQLRSETNDFNSADTAEKLASNACLIAVISLKQPIRDDVKKALSRAKRGSVNVRIVTNNSM